MRFGYRMLRREGCFAALIGSALVIIFLGLSHYVLARASNIGGAEVVPDSSMLFIENSGQYDSRVRFHARSGREMLWITGEGIWITLLGREQEPGRATEYISAQPPGLYQDRPRIAANIKLSFKGANHDNTTPFAPASTIVTIGTARGPLSARSWSGVRYEDLYDGLDLEIFSENGGWNWRLVSKDGNYQSPLMFDISGADRVTHKQNSIEIGTLAGDFTLPELTLQDLRGLNQVGFQEHLVHGDSWLIDAYIFESQSPAAASWSARSGASKPANHRGSSELIYSTYFGSNAWDEGDSIDLDDDGNAYVTGYTQAITFTTRTGPLPASHGIDVFVLKLNETGSEIAYFLWFFTDALNAEDYGNDITVDDQGYAYVTGRTHSPDFCSYFGNVPGYDLTYNSNGDAYLMKIQSDGGGLAFCTYLGGTDIETGNAVSVDAGGNSYVTGGTWSTDFPTTPGAYDRQHNGLRDVFVTKVDPTGLQLAYSTFIGGSGQDEGVGIDTASSGEAFVTGWTTSIDFDTTLGAFDNEFNGGTWDAFVAKVSVGGDELEYGSYLGGSEEDRGLAIVADTSGAAFITGMTRSSDFPTSPGAFDGVIGDGDCGPEICSDGYVSKLDASGEDLTYSTYLGGNLADTAYSLDLDGLGRAYVTGKTLSASTFPTTTNAFDGSHNGGSDAFLSTIGPYGSSLPYSTFLGGVDNDTGYGIELGHKEVVYLTGRTNSADFPTTPGSFDPNHNADYDVFVSGLVVPITSRSFLPNLSK